MATENNSQISRVQFYNNNNNNTKENINQFNSSSSSEQFHFYEKSHFDSQLDLRKRRSENHTLPPQIVNNDIWLRKPPDFRRQMFAPKPPLRNSREAIQPWKYQTERDEYYEEEMRKRKERITSPKITLTSHSNSFGNSTDREFNTLFRVMRPGTAKRLFASTGMNEAGIYEAVKPHDFRGLPPIQSLGLPEFVTAIDKDPYNIRFLLANRRHIVGALHDIQNIRDVSGTMASVVRQPAKWDARLHHPRDPWPAKLAEYSRYRQIGGDPQEAFLDRVDDVLTQKWKKEKEISSTSS